MREKKGTTRWSPSYPRTIMTRWQGPNLVLLRSFFMLLVHRTVGPFLLSSFGKSIPPLAWQRRTSARPRLHLRPRRLPRRPAVWRLAAVVTAGLKIAPGTWQARRGAPVSPGKVRSALVARRRGHWACGQSGEPLEMLDNCKGRRRFGRVGDNGPERTTCLESCARR